jgi:plastocyanin
MTRKRLSIPVAAAASLALALPAQAVRPSQVRAEVGPYRTIQLKDVSGGTVQNLKAGLFRFTIRDRSQDHNFALRGPGVNRALTGVRQAGTFTRTVRLRKGSYTFYCSPHARAMRGTFRVV